MVWVLTIVVYFIIAYFLVAKSTGFLKKALGTEDLTGRQEIFAYLAAFGLFNVVMFVGQVLMAGLLLLL